MTELLVIHFIINSIRYRFWWEKLTDQRWLNHAFYSWRLAIVHLGAYDAIRIKEKREGGGRQRKKLDVDGVELKKDIEEISEYTLGGIKISFGGRIIF